jgi:hypothetical protein
LSRSPELPDAEPRARARRPEIRYVIRGSFRTGWAVLDEVSEDEASLLLGQDPGRAAVLLLQLPGRRAGQTNTRVAHVVSAEEGVDGRWRVGCRFSPPLSEAELALIRQ